MLASSVLVAPSPIVFRPCVTLSECPVLASWVTRPEFQALSERHVGAPAPNNPILAGICERED